VLERGHFHYNITFLCMY